MTTRAEPDGPPKGSNSDAIAAPRSGTRENHPSGAPKPGAPENHPAEPGRTVRGTLLLAAARILSVLPEAPLVAAADSLGELWYRTAPDRAAQARLNLGRVCEGLAQQDRGTPLARRAAADPDALERLVRACFRHAVRYYLEVARAGGYDLQTSMARVDLETPDEIRDALMSGRSVIIVGLHFGAIELPVVYLSHLVGHPVTAPMETVDDPALQRWFVTSRSRVGVNIVPLRDARRALLNAIRRGESVGLVTDRDLTGTGLPVPFFGHPTPMSAAPALLALETGTPVYAASARRTKGRRYAGKLIAVPMPETGTRRERIATLTASIAAAYETLLADGPEQWWGAFHPIWPDLALGQAAGPAGPAEAAGAGREAGEAGEQANPAAKEPTT